MTSEETGAGTIYKRDDKARRKHAMDSRKWNSLNCPKFGEDFPEDQAATVSSFTEAEMKLLKSKREFWANKGDGREKPTAPDNVQREAADSPFKSLSYDEHVKTNWEQFGPMEEEEDFDCYDEDESEQEEECETPETEVNEEEQF